MRAAYTAQKFLSAFEEKFSDVTLKPGVIAGRYSIFVNNEKLLDRKEHGGFPEIKALKQIICNKINLTKTLGIQTNIDILS